MGRAGGSGGSRSGGASRHSTGSRSASSSRSNSSLSNRPPRSYSGGGFGSNRSGFSHNPYSPPPPPPPRPRYRPHFSPRYDSPTYYNRTSYHTSPLSCRSMAIKIIIASIAVIILLMVLGKTLTSCSRRETPQTSSPFSSSANTTKIWSSSYKTSKTHILRTTLNFSSTRPQNLPKI